MEPGFKHRPVCAVKHYDSLSDRDKTSIRLPTRCCWSVHGRASEPGACDEARREVAASSGSRRSPIEWARKGPRLPHSVSSSIWARVQGPTLLALLDTAERSHCLSPPQITARMRKPCLGRVTAPRVSDVALPPPSPPLPQLCEPRTWQQWEGSRLGAAGA